jgi:hypothetical protein
MVEIGNELARGDAPALCCEEAQVLPSEALLPSEAQRWAPGAPPVCALAWAVATAK